MREYFTRSTIKRYFHFLFVLSISFFVAAYISGQSLNTPLTLQMLNCQSTYMIVVNPAAKKQFTLEKKGSKKEERRALKKYVKKVKKDYYENNKDKNENKKIAKGLKIALIILGILAGLFLLFIVVVIICVHASGDWYG
jgi:hypothetical protein